MAYDEAFHFYYEDNLNRLRSLGAEIVNFSPIRDRELPEVDGLYFGGGYPEAFARELASNAAMLAAVRRFAVSSGLIYAECGGLMYLTDAIRTLDGARWPLAAIIPGVAVMSEKLQAIGYVRSRRGGLDSRSSANALSRSSVSPLDARRRRRGNRVDQIYDVAPRWGGAPFVEGYRARKRARLIRSRALVIESCRRKALSMCVCSRASRQPAA